MQDLLLMALRFTCVCFTQVPVMSVTNHQFKSVPFSVNQVISELVGPIFSSM